MNNTENFQPKDTRAVSPARIVGTIFVALGVIFFLVTAFLARKDYKETNNSTTESGVVTSLNFNNEGGAIPVIQFRLNGTKHIIRGSVWSSPPAFEVGESVDLLVDRNNPEAAVINSFIERYFLFAIFGLFAVIFGGIGFGLLAFMQK